MNFRENAIKAAEDLRYQIEIDEEERIQNITKTALKKATKMFDDFADVIECPYEVELPIHIGGAVINIDGIALEYHSAPIGFDDGFRVVGICPDCGQETTSHPCRDLAEIGVQLENFRPDTDVPGATHHCPEIETISVDFEYQEGPTLANILENLLRLVAREEIEKILDNR